nr:MAG TPA: hypothetical protein [Caudoviricetes sp.]
MVITNIVAPIFYFSEKTNITFEKWKTYYG